MRQGQQNRRGRGRSRRGQSPLARNFESNGPDVKIRGTAAHIGEKYLALARDAAAAGDHVLAENFLQHAEHYNRILMTYREQLGPQYGPPEMNGVGRLPPYGAGAGAADEYGNDDDAEPDFNEPPAVSRHGEARREMQPHLFEGAPRQPEEPQIRRTSGYNRPVREVREVPRRTTAMRPQRGERLAGRAYSPVELPAGDNVTPLSRQDMAMRRRERFQVPREHEQPEFLRRPVRRPRRDSGNAAPEREAEGRDEDGGED